MNNFDLRQRIPREVRRAGSLLPLLSLLLGLVLAACKNGSGGTGY
jgi:hypothetical protein